MNNAMKNNEQVVDEELMQALEKEGLSVAPVQPRPTFAPPPPAPRAVATSPSLLMDAQSDDLARRSDIIEEQMKSRNSRLRSLEGDILALFQEQADLKREMAELEMLHTSLHFQIKLSAGLCNAASRTSKTM